MTFLDSNILVYSIDDNSPEKQRKARAIVASAIGRPGFVVSAQVLNEFANVALAKLHLTLEEVALASTRSLWGPCQAPVKAGFDAD